MKQPVWAPGENGPDQPNTARIRDYWLGGSHHIAADREVADRILVGAPHLPYVVRTYRAFLRRVVRYLVKAGVRQFIDLGSGLPTEGNVHQVAQDLDPGCRVIYVDIDPVVVDEGRGLLAGEDNTAFVCADLRQAEQVLNASERRGLLDLDEPVAVLMIDVLHFVSDSDNPDGFIAAYIDAVCSGSYLAISHTCQDEALRDGLATFHRFYGIPIPPLTLRNPTRVTDFFTGLDLIEPGVVPIPLWRPEPDQDTGRNPELFQGCSALGRKP